MDVILNWDGQFNETAKGILKTISDQNRGNNDWSSQWDGKYDDQVKDLVVVQMRAGTYDNLPEPIHNKSKWNVPYTMQLAITHTAATWRVGKLSFIRDNYKEGLCKGCLYKDFEQVCIKDGLHKGILL